MHTFTLSEYEGKSSQVKSSSL